MDPKLNTYLCIGPNCWGKGVGEGGAGRAVANAKKGWPQGLDKNRGMNYDLWLVPESAYIDLMGGMRWDKEDPEPVCVKQVRWRGAVRTTKTMNQTASQMAAAQRGEAVQ